MHLWLSQSAISRAKDKDVQVLHKYNNHIKVCSFIDWKIYESATLTLDVFKSSLMGSRMERVPNGLPPKDKNNHKTMSHVFTNNFLV